MTVEGCKNQNLTTCVYVVKDDNPKRIKGAVYAWYGNGIVSLGDTVYLEGKSSCSLYSGKVMGIFKILNEDAAKLARAFATLDDIKEAGALA